MMLKSKNPSLFGIPQKSKDFWGIENPNFYKDFLCWDDPKLKQLNLMEPHPKGYGFNLWT